MTSLTKVERVLYLSRANMAEYTFCLVDLPSGVKLEVTGEQGPIITGAMSDAEVQRKVEAWKQEGISDREAVRRISTGDAYDCDSRKRATIERLTKSGSIDFVMIGNNTGIGVTKAAAVAEPLRADRALIFWNNYTLGDEEPYRELGYQHFMSGTDIPRFFSRYLALKYSSGEKI